MDDTIRTLQRSASLVKAWGQAQLPNGKTVAETLTLQGLSLWDMVAVDLALYRVPKALAPGTQPPSLVQRVRPYLSWVKHTVLDLVTSRSLQGCAEWPSEPVFLFLGFNAYMYRDVLQPVVTRLAGCKKINTVSLHDLRHFETTASLADRDGFQFFWQHWHSEVEPELGALRRALQATVAELQATGALPRIIQDQGRSLWPQMKDTFDWLFRVFLPRLLPQVAIARHILERHRPALIISPDVADPRTRLYCLLGRQLGIPSLEIQFGLCGAEAIEWQFFVADRLAVWGEKSREILVAHGVPAERITVTGSPRHDSLVNVSDAEVARMRARLGVPERSAVVLFASTYHLKAYDGLTDPELLNAMKRAVFQAADQTVGLHLVVKPHPLEKVQETRKLASARRNIRFADPRADIRDLIKVSDAFVALGSSSTVDALVANKLTICPAFPGWGWSDLFVQSGATLIPRSAEEVARSLQMVVDGSRERVMADLEPARQRFLRQWVFQTDGQASARIEALALHMVKSE